MKEMRKIYSLDTKGKVRVWYAVVDGDHFWTVSGLVDGKHITTDATYTLATNVGRANARTAEEQAIFEAEALYTKKLKRGWGTEPSGEPHAAIFEPMLARTYKTGETVLDLASGRYASQPKFDGIRCVTTSKGMFSREGQPIVSCPHIVKATADFFKHFPDATLDGELYNHDLKDNFQKIVSLVKRPKNISTETLAETRELVKYYIYDVYFTSKPETSFYDRMIFLNTAWERGLFDRTCEIVETKFRVDTQEQLDDLNCDYIEDGYEGQMIRDGHSAYQPGKRPVALLKRKEFDDSEFVIIEINDGLGNWTGKAKSIKFRMDDGTEFSAGVKGTVDFAKDIFANKDYWIGKKATVQYFGLTNDGKPRMGTVQKWHD